MPTVKEYQEYIRKANETESKYGIPKDMLVGLLKTESNLNPRAVSKAGAKGIAQFMSTTAKEFGINPLDPMQSIEAAGKYLAQNYKKLGNWDDTLRSYNMGLGGVQQWKAGKRSLPKETAEYVGKVYKNANIKNLPTPYADATIKRTNDYLAAIPSQPTTTLTNLEKPQVDSTFVEESDEEDTETKEVEQDKDIQEVREKTKEQQFLQDYQRLAQQQPIQQQEEIAYQEEQQTQPQVDLTDIYNQISSFVDAPLAQQGGRVYQLETNPNRLPNESEESYQNRRKYMQFKLRQEENKNPVMKAYNEMNDNQNSADFLSGTIRKVLTSPVHVAADLYKISDINGLNKYKTEEDKNNDYKSLIYSTLDAASLAIPYSQTGKKYQQGGVIEDNMGQWKYPGEVTKINSPNITMANVPYPVLGISDKGEQKMMYPGQDYYFNGAESVTEYPQLTEAEKQFLKELKSIR